MISSVFALALASAGAGQTSAPTQATPPPATAASRPRRVCRQTERVGTILTRRICRTADEWAAIDQAQGNITERDAQHMRNNSRTSMYDPNKPGED